MGWYVHKGKSNSKKRKEKTLDSEIATNDAQIIPDISDKVTEVIEDIETDSKTISKESVIVCQDDLAEEPKLEKKKEKTRKDIRGTVNVATFVDAIIAGQTYFDGITLKGKVPNLGQYADKLKEYFLQRENNDYIFIMNSDLSNVSAKGLLFPCLGFYNTNLTNSDWTDSNIPGVHYDAGSKLEGMKLHMTWVVGGSAYEIPFKDVDFSGAVVQGMTLYKCDLKDVIGLDHKGLHVTFSDNIVGKEDLGYFRGDFGRIVDANVNQREADILDAMNGPVKQASKIRRTKAPEPKFTYHLASTK